MIALMQIILAATVTLTWVADSSSVATDGYRVYVSDTSGVYADPGIDVGNVTTKVLDVDLSTPKYFVVRSYNSFGESSNSPEAVAAIPKPPVSLLVE